MILRAAGHGGLVNPLHFGEERRRAPPWMLAAVGVSVAAHVAAGVWLYNQRFSLDIAPAEPTDPPVFVLERWERPETPAATPRPAPPRIDVHEPPITREPPFVAPFYPTDDAVDTGGPVTLPVDPPASNVGAGNGQGQGEVAAPSVITRPNWLRKPTAAQMERHFPKPALQAEIGGKASIRCAVTLEGALTGCGLVSETPGGYGFGDAAIKLSRYFVMSPKTVDGRPVAGAEVTIPITFNLD